jgi:hypothetical protein
VLLVDDYALYKAEQEKSISKRVIIKTKINFGLYGEN